ncbi:lysis protein [Stenotrophomonas maltophilia]|nr:lysis protein [Stenotrophomonas maltophilia]
MNRLAVYLLASVAWSAAMFGAGWAWRGDRAEGEEAREQVKAGAAQVQQVNQTRAAEHAQAETMAAIGAKHEEERAAAPAVADAVVAGVRAGDLRLRDGWASCETQRLSDAVAAASERDAAAERRAEFAGAVVRVGRDADDQLAACQAVVRALGR